MRRTLILLAVLLVGCAKSEPPATPATETAVTPISLADVAGTWTGTVTAPGSDSVLVLTEMTATAEPTGWTMKLANAKTPTEWTTVPANSVVVEGDVVVVAAGPFTSVLRPGQEVSSVMRYRLENGSMVGTIEATYPANGEVITLNSVATRKAP